MKTKALRTLVTVTVAALAVAPASRLHYARTTMPARTGDDELVGVLRRRGFRVTPQREAILREVMLAEGHMAPQDVARRVQRKLPAVNVSTVYRTLALLEKLGVVRHAHLERGAEYHRASEGDHIHLTCSRCGSEDDLSLEEAESLKRLLQRHRGFLPDLTHFAISGLCRECQGARAG
jgi:Fur family ferric uptake transcriptional regulator